MFSININNGHDIKKMSREYYIDESTLNEGA